jgi:hypothetical protein
MHDSSKKFSEEETSTGEFEALKAAITEAEDLLADFAIEMRRQAKETLLRAEQVSDEPAKRSEPWPTNIKENPDRG